MKNYENEWADYLLDQGANDHGTNGPFVEKFRREIADFYNIYENQIFLTNSGTSALELSLQDIKTPGEISTCYIPAMTFKACRNVIAKERLASKEIDIKPNDLLMNLPKAFESTYKWYEKILMPTLLYGATYWRKEDIALLTNYRRSFKAVIFDSCQAFGSSLPLLRDIYPFSLTGDHIYHCISFNNNKILTTGAGGAIISSPVNIKRIEEKNKQGSFYGVGANKGMPSRNALLGMQAMKNGTFRDALKAKLRINLKYHELLKNLVGFQDQLHGNRWYTYVKMDHDVREKVVARFEEKKIPYRKPFDTVGRLIVANQEKDWGLCLPVSPLLTDGHIMEVADIIKEEVDKYAKSL